MTKIKLSIMQRGKALVLLRKGYNFDEAFDLRLEHPRRVIRRALICTPSQKAFFVRRAFKRLRGEIRPTYAQNFFGNSREQQTI